jgi:hypothetical protein
MFISSLCYAQQATSINFDTLYVVPNHINTNDSVFIICKVSFPSTSSKLDSSSINIIDSTINIRAYYSVGFGASPSSTKDTILLGKLNSGSYKLEYQAVDLYRSESNLDSIYFTVNQVIGITERKNPIQSVSVYPNPSGAAINLNVFLAKAVAATIRITDTQGRIVHTEQLQLNKGETVHSIASKKLSSGVYTLSLWSEGELLEEEKVIVQH